MGYRVGTARGSGTVGGSDRLGRPVAACGCGHRAGWAIYGWVRAVVSGSGPGCGGGGGRPAVDGALAWLKVVLNL
eukprot:scaffold28950_cov51-Phaeocystis_antarctica.AAC.2